MIIPNGQPPTFHTATIDQIRAWVTEADRDADEHATRGGEARARAQQHLAEAARHDEQATQARAIADERRYLLHVVASNSAPEAPAARLRQAITEQAPASAHATPGGA